MKKKLLMGVLVFCFMFVGMIAVKADGPEIKYQVYDNNEIIQYAGSDANGYVPFYDNGYDYYVTEDSGANDDDVVLTKVDDSSVTFVIDKVKLAPYVLIKSSERVDETSDIYSINSITKADSITYYKEKDFNNFKNIVESADKYDVIQVLNIDMVVSPEQLIIPANVTVTTLNTIDIHNLVTDIIIKNIVNNGVLKCDTMVSNDLSGDGKYVVSYRENGYEDGHHIVTHNISSNRINIELENVELKEDMKIIEVYSTWGVQEIDESFAESVASKICSEQFKNYGFNVKKNSNSSRNSYFLTLRKLPKNDVASNVANNVKKAVKNPKTGDSLYTIIGLITLAGALLVVSYKKVLQK